MSEGGSLTIVWAFEPLEELEARTGFVECEELLAERLVHEGRAQDPRAGALLLKPIQPAGTYTTRVLVPAPPPTIQAPAVPTVTKRARGRPRKAQSE